VLRKTLGTVAVLAVLPAASAAPQTPDGGGSAALEVGVVRFYRSAGTQTVVDGFCRVPFTLLDPLSPDGVAAYRVTVSVRDSANLELVTQTWARTVPGRMLSAVRGSALEHFTFAANPGAYTVEVMVRDSATGRVIRRHTPLVAYANTPAASDLLLATAIRPVTGSGDSTARPGELRKGSVIIDAADRPLLTPREAQLGYYLEWYAQTAETAAVSVRIAPVAGGTPIVTTAAQRIPFAAGGGATRGMVDLAGLPPGEYAFEVVVQGRDTTVTRRSPFRMGGLDAGAPLIAEVDPADKFGAMTEAQLDTLYAPLIYIMTSDEVGMYNTLTLEGKRNFLRQFWAKRDPSTGTPRNEAQEDYYSRIGEANRRFREGGTADIPGWRTDRGRIFIKYGPAQETLQRPQAGNTLPYEVWKYTRGRLVKFVFLDQTQFGNYALIWTDDRREPSRPNWQSLLGPEAVQDVERF